VSPPTSLGSDGKPSTCPCSAGKILSLSDGGLMIRLSSSVGKLEYAEARLVFRLRHYDHVSCLNDVVRVADLPGRRRLRSSSSHQLLVPPFRLTTVGRRTFPVAALLLCNSLPSDIQSSPSLAVFRQRLKTFLFRQSFPSIIL